MLMELTIKNRRWTNKNRGTGGISCLYSKGCFKKNRRKNNTFWTVIWQGQYSCLDFWERPTIRFLADLVAKDLLQLCRSCGVQHLPHVGQFSSNSQLISITTTTTNSQLSLLLQVGRLRRWLVLLLLLLYYLLLSHLSLLHCCEDPIVIIRADSHCSRWIAWSRFVQISSKFQTFL